MKTLQTLRCTIDALDTQIMALLEQRFNAVTDIGEAKRASNTAVTDTAREARVLKRCDRHANATHIRDVYQAIFAASKALQKDG